MSHRLLVNPGTPQAWEISLKSGVNRIGRGEANDFQIPHPSVSGAHCEFVVSGTGVTLRDLGSTNGSFVNRAPVRELALQSGQHVQLGSVDMIFEAASAAAPAVAAPTVAVPAAAAPPPPVRINLGNAAPAAPGAAAPVRVVLPTPAAAPSAPPPPPPPIAPRPGGLKLSGLHKAAPEPAAPAALAESVAEAESEPPLAPPVGNFAPSTGAEVCKFHAKIPARFYCGKCQKFYCDMCVATRATSSGQSKTCRACGAHVTPLQVHASKSTTRSFYSTIPGAFAFPFRGFGIVIVFMAAALFGGVDYLNAIGFLSGPFGWIMASAFYGILFLFMQNIIHTTTSDEKETLGFPDLDNLFGAAFQLGATIFVSFFLPIALGLWALLGEQEGLGGYIMATTILGCLYFPMAFLAVAMKDSVMAANPLVVFPAILKLPLEYLVTCVLLIAVYGIRKLGDVISRVAMGEQMTTRDMNVLFISIIVQAGCAFVGIYLLSVTMRVLGMLYNTKKEKFGWFAH